MLVCNVLPVLTLYTVWTPPPLDHGVLKRSPIFDCNLFVLKPSCPSPMLWHIDKGEADASVAESHPLGHPFDHTDEDGKAMLLLWALDAYSMKHRSEVFEGGRVPFTGQRKCHAVGRLFELCPYQLLELSRKSGDEVILRFGRPVVLWRSGHEQLRTHGPIGI